MPFFCSAAMYSLSRACEDCELVGPVMTAIRRCPNDMRYCVASIPPGPVINAHPQCVSGDLSDRIDNYIWDVPRLQ